MGLWCHLHILLLHWPLSSREAMNEEVSGDPFTVNADPSNFKYTIIFSTGLSLIFNWNAYNNNVHKLVGGSGVHGDETAVSPHTFSDTVDHSVHFVDLVIDEIPSISTKTGSNGKKIIDRKPLTGNPESNYIYTIGRGNSVGT